MIRASGSLFTRLMHGRALDHVEEFLVFRVVELRLVSKWSRTPCVLEWFEVRRVSNTRVSVSLWRRAAVPDHALPKTPAPPIRREMSVGT